MNYQIITTNTAADEMTIYYENCKTSMNGTFKLIKFLQEEMNFKIEYRDEKIYLHNSDYKIEFQWIENKGLQVRGIKYPVSIFCQFIGRYLDKLNSEGAQKTLDAINDYLKDFAWFDFMVSDFDGSSLYLIGSVDLSYYYQLEVIFKQATFIQCSSSFHTSPSEETVFQLATEEERQKINQYENDCGYSIVVKIKPEDSEECFFIACYGIEFSNKLVKYHLSDGSDSELKQKIIKKYGLRLENEAWYQVKENSHKAMIFKDSYLKNSDVIGILFRINKLCQAKVKYFREHLNEYEPYKYDYKKGFIKTELWDSEFLKHTASGYILDYRFLQSINNYNDFVNICNELDSQAGKK
jgi:hypothetical protein